MPAHIRAFIVVIVVAVVCFMIMAQPAKNIISPSDFRRWRNLWLSITCVAFLIGNFWLFVMISTLLMIFQLAREPTVPALFWLLLCVIPASAHSIPGFGVINRLFDLDMPRLLSLVILLPALVFGGKLNIQPAKNLRTPDNIIMIFFMFTAILSFRQGIFTVGLRATFIQFLGVILPYYVFSRRIFDLGDIKRSMLAYLLPMVILGALGGFEFIKDWKLYSLPDISKVGYIYREGSLRASTTASGPIVLGYIMMIGIGFLLPLANLYLTRLQTVLAFGVLFLGLIASLSRGPWVGTAALLVIYISTDRNASRKIVGMGFIGVLLLPILSLTPYWQKTLSFIPFVGSVDTGTIDYRTRLFEQSMIVINRNPWFGSIDFRDTPEMQSMIQGQGIIDIVNSYLNITLNYGFVGLFLFSSFFFIVLVNLHRSYKKLPAENSEMIMFGRAIFATLCAALITIATVSSISFVPYLYWSMAGLAVAYINIARETLIASKNNLPR